ncbi:uncharacterized protein Z519_03962 [Cladophialophora bantiana CBS 173.52]|uniref:Uncharacterized protein n=1 Tax=Cladophialophora bantiana (strain ATCC 10958 / CBS 173.52 / CDC B-1940 / NIH 8579) TaxID=1442370 RepID=A0A0D2HPN0_CLAB1|nr:uncharacterized protein Z519_03962 [Cladophialophora bantiana CBS 173.52]KIW95378.1 hypothetical protein Z519_03962 [Cladophialophora bantiana CBS 173.52]
MGQYRNLELLVNVFDQAGLTESFGKFFEKLRICLQDPVICHSNVPYWNPHLLAQDDRVVMTVSFTDASETERFVAPADVFDQLLPNGNMPEAESPAKLRTQLLTHQKQALYFMLRSEKASRIGRSPHHVWSESTVLGQEFTDTITGSCQSLRPKDFYGGLIAD